MRHDYPLWMLVVTALASYPAVTLAWCVGMVMVGHPSGGVWNAAGTTASLAALVLVVVGAISAGKAITALTRGLRDTRRFVAWIARHRIPADDELSTLARDLDIPRLTLVDTVEPIAVTVGMLRPTVVVSTGQTQVLTVDQLRAVLIHERSHLRGRDPLRVLAGTVLAAHLWFLPVAADLRSHARCGYELAADRNAAVGTDRAALAGALLQASSVPAAGRAFVSRFGESATLELRVRQLETGSAPRLHPSPIRSIASAAIVAGYAAAVVGAWTFMVLACPCCATML